MIPINKKPYPSSSNEGKQYNILYPLLNINCYPVDSIDYQKQTSNNVQQSKITNDNTSKKSAIWLSGTSTFFCRANNFTAKVRPLAQVMAGGQWVK